MPDVVCLGELMLRLTTPLHHRLPDAPFLDRCFGGAEANVAVQLAALGASSAFVSRLPDNELGDGCVESLRARSVDTANVVRGGARLGIYFVTLGHGTRPTTVLYDRAASAMCEALPAMFDWDAIFAGARWFHFSGITPALGTAAIAICRDACEAAKKRGLRVSFDVNYRSKLWSTEAAASALRPLMKYVDVCVCGEDEAVTLLGASTDDMPGSLTALHGFSHIAMTRRSGATAESTRLQGSLFTAGHTVISRDYDIAIIDRIGTGDAFTGALIFSLLRGDAAQKSIDFATASCVWKHSIPGDWNRVTVAELEALAAGPTRSAVLR